MERDLAYLGLEREEKLDVYLPPEQFPRPCPAVLLIHGGGWCKGDKADARERNIGETLASHGYVVFSINYRLNAVEAARLEPQQVAWPQSFYDCKSALRFIRQEAERFGVDSQRIAVMGGSAGGHLAMLVGATGEHEESNRHGLYCAESNAVSCIINFYGDYDVRGRKISPFIGATPEETRANVEAASPITYLSKETPPMLIAHGTADHVVALERSHLLTEHLRKLGTDFWYVEISGAPHSFHLQPEQMDLRPVVLAFLEKHLGRRANDGI